MIEKILAYQNTDSKLRDVEQDLMANEDRRKAKAAQKYLEGVEELISKLDMRAAELYAAYESAVQKENALREQEKEYVLEIEHLEDEGQASYVLEEIEELIAQIKALGKDAARIAAEIQAVLAEYKGVKAKTKAAQVQFGECGKKYNEYKAEKQPEMNKIKAELAVLAKDIDAELLEKYNNKRKEKLFPIVVELQSGGFCGGCYTEVSALALSKLDAGEIIEHACGRLLYKKQ